jgi:hypothetical protein
MSHSGWFHRSGTQHGRVRWIPATTVGGHPEPGQMDPATAKSSAPVTPGTYPVVEVKGRAPVSLEDFLGVTSFTVIKAGLTYRVFGTGHPDNAVVRFQQQDLGWDGRDLRAWTITATPSGADAEPADPV